jgi:ferric-dicitrate binding protein FerR (iron transport regulator)
MFYFDPALPPLGNAAACLDAVSVPDKTIGPGKLWPYDELCREEDNRMKACWSRPVGSVLFLCLLACAALGVDGSSPPGAVLRAAGKVQVNGAGSREITTLFSGDSIETDPDSLANIMAAGSSVLVMPNALVKFLGNAVELTQGGIAIATSAGMSAMAFGLTITPTAQTLSKFEVAEDEDSVVIAARQGNVTITDGQETSTVPEGQETRCKKKREGAAPPASGTHVISGKTLAILGAASGATIAGILLLGEDQKKCVSPSGNKKC